MIERTSSRDVLNIPWDEVHEEAERIEHAMSPVLEEKMRAAIGDGDHLPALATRSSRGSASVARCLADVEIRRRRRRPALRERGPRSSSTTSRDAGLHPGLEGKVSASDEEHVTIKSDDGDHVVSRSVAETVSVRADPAPPPRAAIPEQLVLSSRPLRPLSCSFRGRHKAHKEQRSAGLAISSGTFHDCKKIR